MFLFKQLCCLFLFNICHFLSIEAAPASNIDLLLRESYIRQGPNPPTLPWKRAAPSGWGAPDSCTSQGPSDPGPSDPGPSCPNPPSASRHTPNVFHIPPEYQILNWQPQHSYVPLESASRGFRQFWQEIFSRATAGIFNDITESDVYLGCGGFLFAFGVSEKGKVPSPPPPVPWAIIASIAFSMAEAANRGYVSDFVAYVRDPDGVQWYFSVENEDSLNEGNRQRGAQGK